MTSPRLPAALPVTSSPPGRNLVAEAAAIQVWLRDHPGLSPNSISREAGLGRNSLTNLLREQDPENPTARRLDKLYGALRRYGFQPQGPGLPPALPIPVIAHLLQLTQLGYVLSWAPVGKWVVLRLAEGSREASELTSAPTPAQAVAQAATQLNLPPSPTDAPPTRRLAEGD